MQIELELFFATYSWKFMDTSVVNKLASVCVCVCVCVCKGS